MCEVIKKTLVGHTSFNARPKHVWPHTDQCIDKNALRRQCVYSLFRKPQQTLRHDRGPDSHSYNVSAEAMAYIVFQLRRAQQLFADRQLQV